jgi:hypothetical protein
MGSKGLDIGTNMLVAASKDEDNMASFRTQRDAFYRIVPKSEVNKNSIRTSLERRGADFLVDGDTFIVVGEDALQIAIERNDVAKRPLKKGIISPREKDSLPMLKLIIKSLLDEGSEGDTVVYSVPSKPIDGQFDIVYHTEIMGMYLKELGYNSFPLNEGFAIGLSELLDEDTEIVNPEEEEVLTGVCLSYGAGMTNVCVMHLGGPLVEFSLTRSGDYIDQAVGNALDISPSLVQLEKEAGVDLLNPTNKIMEAVSVYYTSVINYTLKNIVYELDRQRKKLPIFRKPIPIVVSGGLTLANGFTEKVRAAIKDIEMPFGIKEVIRAEDPMKAVAKGCLLAATMG